MGHNVVSLGWAHKTADARYTSDVRVGVQSAGSRHILGPGSVERSWWEVHVGDSSGCYHLQIL